jgi:hypothetical protein
MPRPSPRRSLPTFLQPMLASRGTAFDDDAYLFEVKWNGMRMLAFRERSGYRLMNRHGIDTTSRYLLDGEMVVFRDGQPDLARLVPIVEAGRVRPERAERGDRRRLVRREDGQFEKTRLFVGAEKLDADIDGVPDVLVLDLGRVRILDPIDA